MLQRLSSQHCADPHPRGDRKLMNHQHILVGGTDTNWLKSWRRRIVMGDGACIKVGRASLRQPIATGHCKTSIIDPLMIPRLCQPCELLRRVVRAFTTSTRALQQKMGCNAPNTLIDPSHRTTPEVLQKLLGMAVHVILSFCSFAHAKTVFSCSSATILSPQMCPTLWLLSKKPALPNFRVICQSS